MRVRESSELEGASFGYFFILLVREGFGYAPNIIFSARVLKLTHPIKAICRGCSGVVGIKRSYHHS